MFVYLGRLHRDGVQFATRNRGIKESGSNENRAMKPQCQGNGVAGTTVNFDWTLAVRQINEGIVRIVLHLRHHDFLKTDTDFLQDILQQIMCHRTRKHSPGQLQVNCLRFRHADPNGNRFCPLLILQDHHR